MFTHDMAESKQKEITMQGIEPSWVFTAFVQNGWKLKLILIMVVYYYWRIKVINANL